MAASCAGWPRDVGIKAMEFVVPKLYVDQAELEQYANVGAGKYTIGLGQSEMGFCSDREDINSMCLTALDGLMERYGLKYEDIGYVAVGTETIVDKSKSVKTVLMDLFEKSGNFGVEGIDLKNACYGGTAALFGAVSWIESSAWDGRLAVAVAGDIAVYGEGAARATGGAGAVAVLVGPDAAIVLDRGMRATYMRNTTDFCKPDLTSEYPVVDGKYSVECYFKALDTCYKQYKQKMAAGDSSSSTSFHSFSQLDAFVFHSPYCKLVQKSVARLTLDDYLFSKRSRSQLESAFTDLKKIRLATATPQPSSSSATAGGAATRVTVKLVEQSGTATTGTNPVADPVASHANHDALPADYAASQADSLLNSSDLTLDVDVAVEKLLIKASLPMYERLTAKSLLFARRVGNTYTSSVFGCLASYLIETPPQHLPGKRVGVFSFGSGSTASMYSWTVKDTPELENIVRNLRVARDRLDARTKLSPQQFTETLNVRAEALHKVPYEPKGLVDHLFPGTWYLEKVDDKYRRHYAKKPSK